MSLADLSRIKYPENPIVKRTNIIQKVLKLFDKGVIHKCNIFDTCNIQVPCI